MFTRKSNEELNNLTTERLLDYYKAERKRFYKVADCEHCDGCELNFGSECSGWKDYLECIKQILDTRENVDK